METRSKVQGAVNELAVVDNNDTKTNQDDSGERQEGINKSISNEEISTEQWLLEIKQRDDQIAALQQINNSMAYLTSKSESRTDPEINESNPITSSLSDGNTHHTKDKGEAIHDERNVHRGDPIKLLPSFTWDSKDLNETKRFVSKFRTLAKENKWTETHARAAFESKLTGRAKIKYFEGLGDIENISFNERLDWFEKLFSRGLNPVQSQDLFWRCKQEIGESVISFKLRLMSLSNTSREEFGDDTSFNRILYQQFVKGLLNRYRIEIIKTEIKEFHEAVKLALNLEECELRYAEHETNVSGVQDEKEELKMEIKRLQNRLDKVSMNSQPNTQEQEPVCWNCGKTDHPRRMGSENRESSLPQESLHPVKRGAETVIISGVQSDKSDIQRQLDELRNDMKAMQERQSRRESTSQNHQRRCWGCGKIGHLQYMCRNIRLSVTKEMTCNLCKKMGHHATSCYMKIQQEIMKCRADDVVDKERHQLVTNAKMEGDILVTIEGDGESVPGLCIPHEFKEHEVNSNPIQGKRRKEISRQAVCNQINVMESRAGDKKNVIESRASDKKKGVGKTKIQFSCFYDERPMIDVLINGRITRALIDTGAQFSLLDSKFIKDSDNLTYDSTTQLLSPISDKLVQAQKAIIDLELGELKLNPRVCVSNLHQSFPFDFLIGCEILNKCNAVINTGEKTLELDLRCLFSSNEDDDDNNVAVVWCQSFIALEESDQ